MVFPKIVKSERGPNDKAHNTPKKPQISVFSNVAFWRFNPCSSIKNEMEISLMDIVDVREAKNNNKKNATDQKCPPSIWEKIVGSTSNTKVGPAVGSAPKEKTAGKIIMPERTATNVSRMAVITELRTRRVESEKYDA